MKESFWCPGVVETVSILSSSSVGIFQHDATHNTNQFTKLLELLPKNRSFQSDGRRRAFAQGLHGLQQPGLELLLASDFLQVRGVAHDLFELAFEVRQLENHAPFGHLTCKLRGTVPR